ncbi:unnamed protein product [Paramecium primaurelia]|uniref:Protein kinase domain-containing protein n=1 Tax=Paramecium primaurelia TaxID=5886 RepID=A0A8S1PY63_PARPR|nr:unnamed protein product [Paramecium primaurelia]
MFSNINYSSAYQSGYIQQQENLERKKISILQERQDIEMVIYQKLQQNICLNIIKILSINNCEIEIEDIPMTLQSLMKKRQEISFEFSNQEIKLIMAQIINGYQHLRSLGIIHRNLTPQTILVKQIKGRSIIKISDFSVSSLLINTKLRESRAGTPAYWAPEMMLHPQNGYSDNCDIFSLGIILHQLCFQTKMPYNFKDKFELEQYLKNLQMQNFKCQTSTQVDTQIIDLIERMIVFDPQKRVSWDELAQIPFLQQPYLLLNDRYLIDFTRQLGSGMQGVIYLTLDLSKQIELCAKVIETNSYEGNLELKIYQKFKNIELKNIIQVFDFIDDNKQTYVIMEKCDENIQQYFLKQKTINNEEILQFLRQIICGYIELQKFNIIHRDLKPENLLIKYEGRNKIIKIIDFGVSKMNQTKGLANTIAGTPIYSAPEVLEPTGKGYTNKCDIYSLGVMLYYFVFKSQYYNAYSLEELKSYQKKLQLKPFTCTQKSIFNYLIEKMLLYDPEKRITWEELQVEVMIISLQHNLKKRESVLLESISASILKYLDCVQIFTSKLEQELIQYFQTKPYHKTQQALQLFYFLLLFSQEALLDCQTIIKKQCIYIQDDTIKQEADINQIDEEKLQGYIDNLQTIIESLSIKDDNIFTQQQQEMYKELETKQLTCYDVHQYFNFIYKNQQKIYSDASLNLRYYLEKMSNIFKDYPLLNINNILYSKLAEKIKDENAQRQYLEAKKNY